MSEETVAAAPPTEQPEAAPPDPEDPLDREKLGIPSNWTAKKTKSGVHYTDPTNPDRHVRTSRASTNPEAPPGNRETTLKRIIKAVFVMQRALKLA